MREIKFRVWDINNKRYYYDIQGTHDENIGDSFQNIIDSENFIVEQYAGLKDRNGVEIYENDIIDTHWGNEENRLVKYTIGLGFYLTPVQYQSYWTAAYRGEYEVIGNIHEDIDLLNAKNE